MFRNQGIRDNPNSKEEMTFTFSDEDITKLKIYNKTFPYAASRAGSVPRLGLSTHA